MKKLFAILLSVLMLTGMLATLPVAAAGSATITASKTTVTIGEKVTVTAKYSGGNTGIGSLDAYFTYNATAFEYVSCSGATANGGAGNVKISYFCQDMQAPKSVTISVTLKAIAPGAGDFKWETEDMSDDNGNSLGNPGKSLSVTASDPTRSGDATLNYLSPSKGTLNPKFDKNVTEYTVSVPYTVTRCLLNYSTTDIYATSKITDNADLQVGKTVRVITVTAQNGTTKKYTVTITREAQQSTAPPTGTTTDITTSTTMPVTPPAEDALEVSVDGINMLIADVRPEAELPTGFVWDTTTVNEIEVPSGRHEFADLTLLYLTNMEGTEGAFYLYDATTDAFAALRQMTAKGGAYILHNLPDSETGPAGTLPDTFVYEGGEVTAYRYEDSKLADYVLVWATAPGGETGLYSYDTVEETFQRHHTVSVTVTVTKPTTPPEEAEPKPKESDAWVAISNFFQTYGPWMLVGLAAIGFALFMLVSFLASLFRGRKGKH